MHISLGLALLIIAVAYYFITKRAKENSYINTLAEMGSAIQCAGTHIKQMSAGTWEENRGHLSRLAGNCEAALQRLNAAARLLPLSTNGVELRFCLERAVCELLRIAAIPREKLGTNDFVGLFDALLRFSSLAVEEDRRVFEEGIELIQKETLRACLDLCVARSIDRLDEHLLTKEELTVAMEYPSFPDYIAAIRNGTESMPEAAMNYAEHEATCLYPPTDGPSLTAERVAEAHPMKRGFLGKPS